MIQLIVFGITGLARGGILNTFRKGPIMSFQTEVAIIGGGPAGLTAALALARIGRKVTIFDDNKGRNFPAAHMQNFPSRDGTPPREFKEQIVSDLRKYSEVTLKGDRVLSIKKKGDGFIINDQFAAKKIVLAHGVRDILPEIDGIKELWGKAVFHCPFCHGHEFKNHNIGVLGTDSNYVSHMVPLLLSLSSKVTVFTQGISIELPLEILAKVTLVSDPVKKLSHQGEALKTVITSRGEIPIDALVLRPLQELTTDLGLQLGCELTEIGLYKVENEVQTTVPGVFAAGDITMPMQSVLLACASGMKAGAQVSFALSNEAMTK